MHGGVHHFIKLRISWQKIDFPSSGFDSKGQYRILAMHSFFKVRISMMCAFMSVRNFIAIKGRKHCLLNGKSQSLPPPPPSNWRHPKMP